MIRDRLVTLALLVPLKKKDGQRIHLTDMCSRPALTVLRVMGVVRALPVDDIRVVFFLGMLLDLCNVLTFLCSIMHAVCGSGRAVIA